RLERAVLGVMPEIRAEHVEGDALPGGVGRVGEGELRVRVAEALDEPGRRDAVDVRPGPRHPGAALRGQRRAMAPAGRARSGLRGRQALGRRLPESAGPLAGRGLEVIDGLYPIELAFEPIEPGTERRDRAAVGRPVAIDLREDLPAALHHRLVFHASGFVEQRGDLLVRHRLDLVGYFLYLGALGFGGPVALAGFMRRDLVETRRWIDEEEYRLALALAQIMPGPSRRARGRADARRPPPGWAACWSSGSSG